MTPIITKADLERARRALFAQSCKRERAHLEFNVRPISEAWRVPDRVPAFRTAVANCAYIWRDSDVVDRYGPMPRAFAHRRCELRGAGLILPANAPDWAAASYRIWEEADISTLATGDPTAVSAWHVVMDIPTTIKPRGWRSLLEGFVDRELAAKGAATAWAIHALEGADGFWIVRPHVHLVVSARHWRHDRRHGWRYPEWISSWRAHKKLEHGWGRHCAATVAASHWGWIV